MEELFVEDIRNSTNTYIKYGSPVRFLFLTAELVESV
jgi:hypothetical protein